jgi:hypothetical protein
VSRSADRLPLAWLLDMLLDARACRDRFDLLDPDRLSFLGDKMRRGLRPFCGLVVGLRRLRSMRPRTHREVDSGLRPEPADAVLAAGRAIC